MAISETHDKFQEVFFQLENLEDEVLVGNLVNLSSVFNQAEDFLNSVAGTDSGATSQLTLVSLQ